MKKELATLIQKGVRIINQNSPTILTGIAVLGIVGIVVTTVKATPKALEILEEKQKKLEELEERQKTKNDETEFDYKKEKRIALLDTGLKLAKTYCPVIIISGLTIAAVIFANRINIKRLATVASLYSASDSALKEWKNKTLETVGKSKEAEINGKVNDESLLKHPLDRSNVVITGNGETLCYDKMSGRYFKSDAEYIRKIMNDFNFQLHNEFVLSLNEFYEMLGLDSIDLAEDIGWNANNPLEVRFDSRLASNGSPCLVLDYYVKPIWNYRDF